MGLDKPTYDACPTDQAFGWFQLTVFQCVWLSYERPEPLPLATVSGSTPCARAFTIWSCSISCWHNILLLYLYLFFMKNLRPLFAYAVLIGLQQLIDTAACRSAGHPYKIGGCRFPAAVKCVHAPRWALCFFFIPCEIG